MTRTFWMLSMALGLSGCCMGGGASTTGPGAPEAPAPPTAPVGPRGPGAPGCPDLAASLVGTWSREGFVEEYRADGTYVINGHVGTFRWLAPGHALLDVPEGSLHVEYDLALADTTTLVAADPNGIGTIYTRTSPPPAIATSCFDLGTAWIGTWIPNRGGSPEQYDADGVYTAPGRGRWTFTAPGRLHLENDNGVTSDYVLGMASGTTALAVSLPPLAPAGTAYHRQ
jgi:hypothetical protein